MLCWWWWWRRWIKKNTERIVLIWKPHFIALFAVFLQLATLCESWMVWKYILNPIKSYISSHPPCARSRTKVNKVICRREEDEDDDEFCLAKGFSLFFWSSSFSEKKKLNRMSSYVAVGKKSQQFKGRSLLHNNVKKSSSDFPHLHHLL